MDNAAIEADLQRRIRQSKELVERQPAAKLHVRFKNNDWTAIAREFMDHPKRLERYEMAFELSADYGRKQYRVILKARIKPIATDGAVAESHPYISFYVTDQSRGADASVGIHWFHPPSTYVDLVELPIEDWYQKLIAHAMTCKGAHKVLLLEMQIAASCSDHF
jgi:hypothetical protein